jgi:hypothetical protein
MQAYAHRHVLVLPSRSYHGEAHVFPVKPFEHS